jgi:hypothetical protein
MAGGIDWFRWHHGSITDPKFQLVAKKASARFGDVIALWAFILEMASADSDRGNIGPVDFETLDYMLGAEEGTSVRILDAMTARGLIVGNRVASWEKRQPKRERENDNSTGRVRAFRENKRHETPCNANDSQETPREEKSRVDIKTNTPTQPDGFAEFWSAYPKKVAKGDAEKAWKKHKPDIAACLAALAIAKTSPDWTKDGGQFIPYPATWLNGKRWEDAGSTPATKTINPIFAGAI